MALEQFDPILSYKRKKKKVPIMTDPRNPPNREDLMKIYDHMPKEYFVSFVRALWFDGYDAGHDKGYQDGKDWCYGPEKADEDWLSDGQE
jgi:hypothetical protein